MNESSTTNRGSMIECRARIALDAQRTPFLDEKSPRFSSVAHAVEGESGIESGTESGTVFAGESECSAVGPRGRNARARNLRHKLAGARRP